MNRRAACTFVLLIAGCVPSFDRDIDAGIYDSGESDSDSDSRVEDAPAGVDASVDATTDAAVDAAFDAVDAPDAGTVPCTPRWSEEHERPSASAKPELLVVEEESTGACIRRLSAFESDATRLLARHFDAGGENAFLFDTAGSFFQLHTLNGFVRVDPFYSTLRQSPAAWLVGEPRYRYSDVLRVVEDNLERATRGTLWRNFEPDVRTLVPSATFVNTYGRKWSTPDFTRVALTTGTNAACSGCRIFTYEVSDPLMGDELDLVRSGTSDDDGRGNPPIWADLSPDGQHIVATFSDEGRPVLRANTFDLSEAWTSRLGPSTVSFDGTFVQISEGQPAYAWTNDNGVYVYDFLAETTYTLSERFTDCSSCANLSVGASWDVPGWIVVGSSTSSDAVDAIELVDIRGAAGVGAVPRYTIAWTRAGGGPRDAARMAVSNDLLRVVYASSWDGGEVRDFYEISISELPPEM